MTDFSKYIIATDLDGTFFGTRTRFVPRNIEALKRFCAGGGLFTLATGRVQLNMYTNYETFAEVLSAPAVMSNGAYLYNFSTDEEYLPEFIPEDIADELLVLAHTQFPDVDFRVHVPQGLRIERDDRTVGRDARHYKPGSVIVAPSTAWPHNNWYKIVFRATFGEKAEMDEINAALERLKVVRAAVAAQFGDRIEMATSDPAILEIQAKGVTKAHGIDKLRKFLGNDQRLVITCGDFENDIPMHRAADIAIAPGNALPEVKAICKHTVCHCDDGVIADVIELIERGEI
ncbi:MAG: HAD hydrolase family protein [Clostridia bacterium]|nr:HAD hydrolase family protein [Clostridia bacterium]